MHRHPHETEVKFRVVDRPSLEARLLSLGARARAPEYEYNLVLDDRKGSLREKGMALRLRETEGRGLVTLKGKKTVKAGVKTRVEIETEVDLPRRMLSVFEALGYDIRFRYEKRRATWTFEDPGRPVVVIDETPIGLFAEIEGEDPAIRRLAAELDVREGEFLKDSYLSLYRLAREKDSTLPPDMVFR